jgi:hypothetical protein
MKANQISDLGSAALLDVGTQGSPNSLVQLDSQGRLPAIDGSQITGVGGGTGGTAVRTIVNVDVTSGNYQISSSIENGTVFVVSSDITAYRDVYLPAANSVSSGFYLFVSRDGGTSAYPARLKTHPSSSDTLNRAKAHVDLGVYDSQKVVSDGSSKWIMISQGKF